MVWIMGTGVWFRFGPICCFWGRGCSDSPSPSLSPSPGSICSIPRSYPQFANFLLIFAQLHPQILILVLYQLLLHLPLLKLSIALLVLLLPKLSLPLLTFILDLNPNFPDLFNNLNLPPPVLRLIFQPQSQGNTLPPQLLNFLLVSFIPQLQLGHPVSHLEYLSS